jgi:putative transcriptional regulator
LSKEGRVLIRPLQWLLAVAALLAPAALFGAAPPDADTSGDGPTLTGQLLIASPEMHDPRFAETVLVMVRHNRDGAMAIVINRPIGEQPLNRLLEAIGETSEGVTGSVPVFIGGPVESDALIVLHSTDYRRAKTIDVASGVALTATPEILRDIAGKTGPQKSLLAFGYAGWVPGQLENELAHNAWYTAPIDSKLVFDEPREKVWELAVERRTRDL